MSRESSEVRAFGSGDVYVAPVGTVFPPTISDPISANAGWINLGYVSTEGARFNFGREVNEIMAWQAYDPIRVLVTSVPKEVSFDLAQFNRYTWALALGGGTFTEPSPGEFHYEPPDESSVDERALIIEALDGDYTYRWGFRKGTNRQGIEFAAVRTDASWLAITMKILAADAGVKPWFVDTDDPNFADLLEAGS